MAAEDLEGGDDAYVQWTGEYGSCKVWKAGCSSFKE
jgi:hypothetical protein